MKVRKGLKGIEKLNKKNEKLKLFKRVWMYTLHISLRVLFFHYDRQDFYNS